MRPGGDGEDVVEFLERPLLRLRHEQENHAEGDDVQAGVEAEGTHDPKGLQQRGEGDREDGSVEEARRHRPRHAHLAMGKREDFGRVGERDRALAGGVKGREKEDEERDDAEVGRRTVRDEEAEARRQQRPGHLREGEEEQGATAVGVDRPHRRPREHEVDGAEPPRGEEGVQGRGAGFDEDGRGVEGDDVDAAHLLRDHDRPGRQRGAADPGDGEELDEAGEVVVVPDDGRFLEELRVDVVQIARRLQGRVSKPTERFEGVAVAPFLDVPAGRLGTEVDADDEGDGGDEGRAQLQPPGDIPGIVDGEVGAEAEEDAEGGPHLPAHHEAAPDGCRAILGRVDGNGGGFAAHADAEEDARHEELRPGLGDGGAEDGKEAEDGGDEDGASAAGVVVQGIGQPAAAAGGISDEPRGFFRGNLQHSGRDVGTRIDDAHDPRIDVRVRGAVWHPQGDRP